MRRSRSILVRLVSLGVSSELSPETTQLVTLTNGAALLVVGAAVIAGTIQLSLSLPWLAACTFIGAGLSSVPLPLNARGSFVLAAAWLVVSIVLGMLIMAMVAGPSFLHPLTYFTGGLPFLLIPLRKRLVLAVTVVCTTATFGLLTWPVLLPGPLIEVDMPERELLLTATQILAWAALFGLILVFALTREFANEQLRSTLQKTQVASAAKSAFLANTSHELRTPMGAILGYADLLLAPGISPSQRAQFIRTIRRNGRHLLELVDQILDHAKIEAGQLDVALSMCSLDRIVADVEALMKVRAAAKSVSFSVEYATRIPVLVETDELRVRQILVNLLGNAVKFTEQGQVKLRISLERIDGKAELRFAVTDSGPGIDQNRLQEMFKPFTQADMSTQRVYGGTGLGLAISKQLAELLGGRLEAESALGQGSTFTLTLALGPVSGLGELVDARTSIEPARVRSRKRSHMHGTRVLVAEDGYDNQRLIELYLQRAGAEPVLAGNGAKAIALYERALAEEQPFDIILMDMQMPELDGYETTRRLRAMGCETPIIALTAHAMIGAREECLNVGCNDYFVKPIDFDSLFTAMTNVIDERSESGRSGRLAAQGSEHDDTDSTETELVDVSMSFDSSISVESELPRAAPVAIAPEDSESVFTAQLASLTRDFVQRLPERVAKLQAALVDEDFEQLRFLAHRLRGTAGTYGLERVSELAGEIMLEAENSTELKQIRAWVEELAELAAQASLA